MSKTIEGAGVGATRISAIGAVVLALALAASGPTAEAKRPRLRCNAGVTLFVEGKLRIFGVRFKTADEEGYEEYACLGTHRRPLSVGLVGHDNGVGSSVTPAYAFGGGRYLGAYHSSDSEGGPDASYDVVDLERRRTVLFSNAGCCERVPGFRVASNGALITNEGEGDDAEVDVQLPGSRHAKVLSTPGLAATDLAVAGNVVYWTDRPHGAASAARSATLAGVPDGPEAHMLAPVRPRAKGVSCAAARGRTIVGSRSVRVYERTTSGGSTQRLACRIGGPARVRAGLPGAPAPRIVDDRWLLSLGVGRRATTATVIDMKTGDILTSVDTRGGPAIRQATMLSDGSLAWLEVGGRVLAQRPGDDAAVELAAASAAPSALAASRHTVYWTSAGAPHGARPPR